MGQGDRCSPGLSRDWAETDILEEIFLTTEIGDEVGMA